MIKLFKTESLLQPFIGIISLYMQHNYFSKEDEIDHLEIEDPEVQPGIWASFVLIGGGLCDNMC